MANNEINTLIEQQSAELLIVDDQERNLQLLGSTLQKRGYETVFATTGPDALEAVKHAKPDLILLDVNMPGMDGYEVCRRLKANPEWADIPVIFVTARTSGDDIVRGFESGAQDYITKPIHAPELLKRIDMHLSLARYAKALEALNDNQKRFFSLLSHDLRSPVAATTQVVSQISDILPDWEAPAELSELFADANEGLVKLQHLIDDVLEWAQLQMDTVAFHPETFNFEETAYTALSSVEMRATQKGITLDTDIAEDCPAYADKQMVQAILRNLLSNAVKFTPKGGEITLSAHQTATYLTVRVTDTGMGMAADTLEALRDSFAVTLPSHTGTEAEKGTGLGLVLCRKMITKHGGNFDVESETDKGTSFSFTLPKETQES